MSSISLLEASRPRTSLGTLFPDVQVAALRQWLGNPGTTGPALATASPGSGLTMLVRLMLAELGLESIWITTGTPRIRALLAQAGANPVSVTMRRKVIVVDELDALGSADSSALADVLAFARSKPPLPVLFATHATRSQKPHEFAKTWPRFAFGRPTDAKVRACLARLVAKHGIDQIDDSQLDDLVKRARGDVRAAVMALDLARRGGGGCGGGGRHACQIVDIKDEATEGLDLVEAVLRGQRGGTVAECLKMFAMEPAVMSMGLYENYLASLGSEDMEAATRMADEFAAADCVDRYMYARQAWDAHDVYGARAVAGPSMALRRHRRSKPNASLGVTKFGSVWSKVYNMCAKTKHLKQISNKYAEAGLAPLTACDLAWVREGLRAALRNDDEDAVRRLCHPLAPPEALLLARLDAAGGSAAWYKQATHARVKRALLPCQTPC